MRYCSFLKILGFGSILLAPWVLGFLGFFIYVVWIVIPQPLPCTDGIVVFTGGTGRIATGEALSHRFPQEKILISGVTSDARYVQAILAKPLEHLTLGYQAHNTLGNARETAQWAQTHNLKSLKVVTSDYHMARSLLELFRAFPQGVFVPCPVKTTCFLNPQCMIREYHKFLYAFGRFIKDTLL